MSVSARLAAVVGGVLLVVTLVFAFIPMSSSTTGLGCGSAAVAQVSGDDVSTARQMAVDLKAGKYDLLKYSGDDTLDQAAASVVGTVECADQIHDRRLIVLVLAIITLITPAAAAFVGAGTRRAA